MFGLQLICKYIVCIYLLLINFSDAKLDLQDFFETLYMKKEYIQYDPITNPIETEHLFIPYDDSSFSPLPGQLQFFENFVKIRKMTKILEVGPGYVPFKLATHVIDHQLEKWELSDVTAINLDLDFENIPYEDNYFDFVYCRHVLEDLNYPLHAYKEITRVSKNGFF